MRLPLRYYGDPILRAKTKKVEVITDEIKKLVADMIETMDACNGVGLAANQVGSLYKILVIRPEVTTPDGKFALGPAEAYINPVLSNPSKETEIMTEGCLSFPGLHAEVERPYSVHVEALDVEGRPISVDLYGFKARELFHENDHLNGTVFVDRVSPETRELINPALREIKAKYKKS